ncbi:MAG: 3'(2'),5'-bisphosphate nucleotidase CysQ [Gammaproteobacteria bacterium]|nr:3'(2'),5'-bisphosphate nucleotidase CysQ [Gammaproteobacteria bacterium]
MKIEDHLLDTLLFDCIKTAKDAGGEILRFYHNGYEVEHKSDESPITEADLAAHRHIVGRLHELTPDYHILSEEAADISFEERRQWQTYWLIDPLDGTREFIKHNDEFSINIALIHKRQPILGVVYAPALDLLYFARRGSGAFKCMAGEAPTPINVRPAPSDSQLTVCRSRAPGLGPNLAKFLDALGAHKELSMGSALKSCLVAEGLADVYARLGPTCEWDTAAAQCIVEEAGGRMVDVYRRHLRYNTRESLLNPNFLVYGDPTRDWTGYLKDCDESTYTERQIRTSAAL